MSKKLPVKAVNNIQITESFSLLKIKKITNYIDEKNIILTNKQRKFVFYYVMTDEDRYKSAELAGYKGNNVHVTVSQLLRQPKIQDAIKLVIENELKLQKLSIEYSIFKRLKMILDADILDYVDDQGFLKKRLSDIPKPLRQLIKKIEVKYYGKDAKKKVTSFEILGKEWAMEKLMKYIDMIKPDNVGTTIITDEVKMNLLRIFNGGK